MTQSSIIELSKLPSATVHEALGKIGALSYKIKPIHPSMKLCGPAVTVHTYPGDNLIIHRALAEAPAGSVLVVYADKAYGSGYWGEIMALAAQERGIAGLVIDGCVRDAEQIEAMGFPVFCRGLCIKGTTKFGNGRINQPIKIGKVKIRPNDVILGDRDGVVVVPQDRIQEAIDKSIARESHEQDVMSQLRSGKSTLEIFGWE